ncbi:MAG TPA: hypothetical protein VEW48_27005 [Thermoanaerobaculia bacterium]|nr:hypothetical protein [Thermoanaerobaculia bacterium]
MDDSERSYGYSKDIYHGSQGVGGHYDPGHSDKSYESNGDGDPAGEEEPSPEEAAMHVVDREKPRAQSPEEAQPVSTSDSGGRSTSNRVDSFTWATEGSGGDRGPRPK